MKNTRLDVKKIVFWTLLIFIVLYLYFYLKEQLEIDSCLDQGGKWGYAAKQCLFAE